jgi:hypothetical protein
VRVTEAGAAVYERAARAVALVREAREVVTAQRSEPSGLLRIPLDLTDKAAKAAQLAEQRERGAAKKLLLDAKKRADEDLRKARGAHDRAKKAFDAHCQRLGEAAPASVERCRAMLRDAADAAQAEAQAAAQAPSREARCAKKGGAASLEAAVRSVLGQGRSGRDKDVVGVVAALACVQDESLCRTLSWSVASRMCMLVVRTEKAMHKLRGKLRAGAWKDAAIPSFLPLDCTTPCRAEEIGLEQAIAFYASPGEDAQLARRREAWLRDALRDTEPALKLPLYRPKAGDGAILGLLGHAVNLLRPVASSERLRALVLWPTLLEQLVFDTLPAATSYKKACAAEGVRCPPIVTMDCERCQTSGIVDGGKPPPATLAEMDACFGSAAAVQPAGGDGQVSEAEEQAAQLLEACEELQRLASALRAAGDKAQQAQQAVEAAPGEAAAGEAPARGRKPARAAEPTEEEQAPPKRRRGAE